ncbi:MAG: hypothetical protein ABTQ73_05120 [Caldilineales bacterium]
MTTRTTIYLDETLLQRIRLFVSPRGLSPLISELLDERISQLERAEIEAAMQKGYLATREDRRSLNDDWQITDTAGWPA